MVMIGVGELANGEQIIAQEIPAAGTVRESPNVDDVARLVQEDMDFVAKASHGEMNEVEEDMGGVVGEELVGVSENEALL